MGIPIAYDEDTHMMRIPIYSIYASPAILRSPQCMGLLIIHTYEYMGIPILV